jgi:hypothetical protein
MKTTTRSSTLAAILALAFLMGGAAKSQTMVDMRSQARNIDFSKATATRPFTVGTPLPPVCSIGQTFFKSDAAPGQNLYLCTGTNIWSAVASSAQAPALPSTSGNAGKVLGTNGAAAAWRSIAGFTDNGSALTLDGTVLGHLAGNNVWTGHNRYPASPVQTLSSPTDVITCNRRTVAVAASTELTLTSAATILAGADGQVCVIVNVGTNRITLMDEDALSASNLQLTANSVTIPPKAQLSLQYNTAIRGWIQDGVASVAQAAGGGGSSSGSGLPDTGVPGLVVRTTFGEAVARTLQASNGLAVTNGNAV